MQKNSLYLILTLFLFGSPIVESNAQELFTESPIKLVDEITEIRKKVERYLENPLNQSVTRIELNNLQTIEKDGKISFRLPNDSQLFKAYAQNVEVAENGDYQWLGKIINAEKKEVGYLNLHSIDKAISGEIVVMNRYFTVEDFGASLLNLGLVNKRITYLIEKDNQELEKYECKVHRKAEGSGIKPDDYKATSRISICTRNVRILLLFTDNAEIAANPVNYGNNFIIQANQSLTNSDINDPELTFELAGVEEYNGVPDDGTLTMFQMRNAIPGDMGIETLRANADADLVVLLTDLNECGPFGCALGIAFLEEYGDENFGFAIAEIDVPAVNAIHEVGHLFGCKHDDDNTTTGNLNSYARGHNWQDGGQMRETIMNQGLAQILNFSNPDVDFNNIATGTRQRNNARQLRNTALTISQYEDGGDPVDITITGPNQMVDSGYDYTWVGQSCNEIINQYQWSWSSNGFTYYNVGTNSNSLTLNGDIFPNSASTIFIRLIATFVNGQQATEIFSVQNNQDSIYYRIEATINPTNEWLVEKGNRKLTKISNLAAPNPTRGIVQIITNLPNSAHLTIEVFNELGQLEKSLLNGHSLNAGRHIHEVDLSNLSKGIKFIRIFDGERLDNLPVILH